MVWVLSACLIWVLGWVVLFMLVYYCLVPAIKVGMLVWRVGSWWLGGVLGFAFD